MKRILLFLIVFCFSVFGYAQNFNRDFSKQLENQSLERPVHYSVDQPTGPYKGTNPYVQATKAINEVTIGETMYDLQTNSACQNRVYLHSDGTIGAVWTRGISSPNFSGRGTGYNYFSATWAPYPTARIESTRCGWPSYAPLGPGGEIVVSHNGTDGLEILTRTTKGTGTWYDTTFLGPVYSDAGTELLWPRMVTAGENHDTVHMIATSTNNAGVTYKGQFIAILYSRSVDGGVTWDKKCEVLTEMDSTNYNGFSGDAYAWAEPKGNTIAFVVGDSWFDLFLMKSDNAGETWTKKKIFTHPYPMFKEETTLVLDTPYVCDGSIAVALDNNGMAHVLFSLMRVLNSDTTDAVTSYFPITDGLAYWNETMSEFSSLDIDSVYQSGNLVGYIIDTDGDSTFTWLSGSAGDIIGKYYQSLASYPGIVIDGNNDIYISFSLVVEHLTNSVQHYRHLYSRKSMDGGLTWSDFYDLTNDVSHDYDECVFASLSPNSDSLIHLIFQADYEPGIAVSGDEDPYANNRIIYMGVPKSDWGNPPAVGISEIKNISFISQNYPNPFNENSFVDVRISRSTELRLEISSMVGQKISEINKGKVGAGNHTFTINGNNLSSGIYFYTVYAGNHSVTKKMIKI